MDFLSKILKRTEVKAEPPKDTVKVTDVDGSVFEVPVGRVIGSPDRVLVCDSGRTYHTHLNCFTKWGGDAQKKFTGWTIIKKSEAIAQDMKYCKICAIADKVTLDDLLAELDEELDEE